MPTPGDIPVMLPLKTTGAFLSVSRLLDAPGPRRRIVPTDRAVRVDRSHPSARGLLAFGLASGRPGDMRSPLNSSRNQLGRIASGRHWSGASRGLTYLAPMWRSSTAPVAWQGSSVGWWVDSAHNLGVGVQFSNTAFSWYFLNRENNTSATQPASAIPAEKQDRQTWFGATQLSTETYVFVDGIQSGGTGWGGPNDDAFTTWDNIDPDTTPYVGADSGPMRYPVAFLWDRVLTSAEMLRVISDPLAMFYQGGV